MPHERGDDMRRSVFLYKMKRELLRLYAITDEAADMEKIESALKGGVTILQLREKCLADREYVQKARQVKALCGRYGVPLIINDNVEVALLSGADGVHVGAEDMPVREIRRRAEGRLMIGATTKTVSAAQEAERGGADYLGVGAVFPSPTKRNALRVTKEDLKRICASTSLPVVAIGGIDSSNIGELAGCGMEGFAVVSAVFGAEDVEKAARALKERAFALTNK